MFLDLCILGATSPRWKSRCSLQSMTRTVMEFSGCHPLRYMHLSSDLCIHLMCYSQLGGGSTNSWGSGERQDWPGFSWKCKSTTWNHSKMLQNRPPSGKRPGSSRPVSGALDHQRINHEEFGMWVVFFIIMIYHIIIIIKTIIIFVRLLTMRFNLSQVDWSCW